MLCLLCMLWNVGPRGSKSHTSDCHGACVLVTPLPAHHAASRPASCLIWPLRPPARYSPPSCSLCPAPPLLAGCTEPASGRIFDKSPLIYIPHALQCIRYPLDGGKHALRCTRRRGRARPRLLVGRSRQHSRLRLCRSPDLGKRGVNAAMPPGRADRG